MRTTTITAKIGIYLHINEVVILYRTIVLMVSDDRTCKHLTVS